jgi:hypothetical protein
LQILDSFTLEKNMDVTFVKPSTQIVETIHTPEHWLQFLDEENVQLVILDADLDLEFAKAIRSQPGWNIDFEDDELVIFTLDKRN